MRDYLFFLLFGLLIYSINAFVSNVISAEDSFVGGQHELTIELKPTFDIPTTFTIIFKGFNLVIGTDECNEFITAHVDSAVLSFRFCHNFSPDINIGMTSLAPVTIGKVIAIKIQRVQYKNEMDNIPFSIEIRDGSSTLLGSANNVNGLIPRHPALLPGFTVNRPFIKTCRTTSLSFTVSLSPFIPIKSGSKICLKFPPDIDITGCSLSGLNSFSINSQEISSNAKTDYSDTNPLSFVIKNFKGPSIETEFYITINTYSLNNKEVYTGTTKLSVKPTHSSDTPIIDFKGESNIICTEGTYEVEIKKICGEVPNAEYMILSPTKFFDSQSKTSTSNQNLIDSVTILFTLRNPCSVVPESVLKEETFVVTVINGILNKPVFTVNAKLLSTVTYKPGSIIEFKVQPDRPRSGDVTLYTFTIKTTNAIPENGKIHLTLNPKVGWIDNPTVTVTVDDITHPSPSATYSENVIKITLPISIPARQTFEIKVANLKNPSVMTIYRGFKASSYSNLYYKIDESEIESMQITEPGSAEVTYLLSKTRNLEPSKYSFTFSSSNIKVSRGHILGIKIPNQVGYISCEELSRNLGIESAPFLIEEKFDCWLKANVDSIKDGSLHFEYEFINPATTAETDDFQFVLFNNIGNRLLLGKVKVKTNTGAHLASGSTFTCSETCPRCNVACTLILHRQRGTPFKTVVIGNERLNTLDLTCKYDEGGMSYNSVCSIPNHGTSTSRKIQLTIDTLRNREQITITNIVITYPEYEYPLKKYPIKIYTYNTETINPSALIDEDEATDITGICVFPCKTCGTNDSNNSNDDNDIKRASTCTACNPSGTDKYLLSSKCVNKITCEDGRHVANDVTNVCDSCDASKCYKCSGAIDSCTECNNNKFLNGNECVASCIPYGYNVPGNNGVGGRCHACKHPCVTCTTELDCESCVANKLFVTSEKRCLDDCPSRHYRNNDKCYPCLYGCQTCDNPNTCLSCTNDMYYYRDQCYTSCPSGTFYPSGTNICKECDISCSTCTVNKFLCDTCAPNYYMYDGPQGRHCVSPCPSGSTVVGSICKLCITPCLTCNGLEDYCTTCIGTSYAYNGNCIANCPDHSAPSLSGPRICVDCASGCEECTWDNSGDSDPKLCLSCLPGFKYYDSRCFRNCPDGTVPSSNGLTCTKTSINPSEDDPSSDNTINYIPFPHLMTAGLLGIIVVAGQAREARAVLASNLLLVINYMAISSYIAMGITAFSEETLLAIITAVVVAFQILLNVVFLVVYKRKICGDPGFVLWSKNNKCVKSVIMGLSTVLTFQTSRLFYSRFLGFGMFFVKFEDFDNLLNPLNYISFAQIILVHCLIVIIDIRELIRLSWGTTLYIFIIESLILSLAILLLFCYKMKYTKSTIEELENGNQYRSMSTDLGNNTIKCLKTEEKERLADSVISELGISLHDPSDKRLNFKGKKIKRRHSFHRFKKDTDSKVTDERRISSHPSSPRAEEEKSMPKIGESTFALATRMSDSSNSKPPKELENLSQRWPEMPLPEKINAFRRHMEESERLKKEIEKDLSKGKTKRKPRMFSNGPNPFNKGLDPISEIPEFDKNETKEGNITLGDSPIIEKSAKKINALVLDSSSIVEKDKHNPAGNVIRPSSPPQVNDEGLNKSSSKPLNPIGKEMIKSRYKNLADKDSTASKKTLIASNKYPHTSEHLNMEEVNAKNEEDKSQVKNNKLLDSINSIKGHEANKNVEKNKVDVKEEYINNEDILGDLEKDPDDGYLLIKEDSNGILLDRKGRRVNRLGYLIDDKENIINQNGEFVKSKEDFERQLEDDEIDFTKTKDLLFKEKTDKEPLEERRVEKVEDINSEINAQHEEIEQYEEVLEERKSICSDKQMEESPSKFYEQNQAFYFQFNNISRNDKAENSPTILTKPESSNDFSEQSKKKEKGRKSTNSSHKRKSEKGFTLVTPRKGPPDANKNPRRKVEEGFISQIKLEFPQHKVYNEDIKDKEQEEDYTNNVEDMFLESNDPPEESRSIASHISNRSRRAEEIRKAYSPKQKPKINGKRRRKKRTNSEKESDDNGISKLISKSYRDMKEQFERNKRFQERLSNINNY